MNCLFNSNDEPIFLENCIAHTIQYIIANLQMFIQILLHYSSLKKTTAVSCAYCVAWHNHI